MNTRTAVLLLAAILTAATPAVAREESLQDHAAKKIAEIGSDRFFTLSIENDLFGGGTDRNYTSGVRLTYFNLGTPMPAFAYSLDKYIPTFSINETTSVYYSFGQNLYTPSDITHTAQMPGDHPWAGFLYASAGLSTITKNHVDDLEATIGVVGPAALGEPTQKFIHHVVNSPQPQGWDNQLKNEPGLILSWQRRAPMLYHFKSRNWAGGAEPHFGITLGNIYTYTNAGISFRLTPFEGLLQDDPVRVRPAMPGTGAFVVPDNAFNWYLFAGADSRAVARNIFLDGNTFSKSYSVDKKPVVTDLTAGVAFTYGSTRVTYATVYRTREFYTQKDPDVFGTVSLGLRF